MGRKRDDSVGSLAHFAMVCALLALAALPAATLGFSATPESSSADDDFYRVATVKLRPLKASKELRKRSAAIQEYTEVQSRQRQPDAWKRVDTDFIDTLLKGQSKMSDGADKLVIIEKIIAIGEKIWPIIKANEPVAHVAIDHADIVPEGIDVWQQLEGWGAPRSRYYGVSYENIFGVTLAEFKFQIVYTPGGTYKGKGKYLSFVSALVSDLYVFYGVTFNANATIVNVVNAGSTENPLAAAQIQVDWSMDTFMAHDQGTHSVYVRGDGYARDL